MRRFDRRLRDLEARSAAWARYREARADLAVFVAGLGEDVAALRDALADGVDVDGLTGRQVDLARAAIALAMEVGRARQDLDLGA